jgi:hypothetical protein
MKEKAFPPLRIVKKIPLALPLRLALHDLRLKTDGQRSPALCG